MEPKFKPGDLVRLKSGSPVMTVHHTDEVGEVVLNWFDGKRLQSHVVSEALLEGAVKEDIHRPRSMSIPTKTTW